MKTLTILPIIIALAACHSHAAPFQNGSFEINGGDMSQTASGWMTTQSVFFNNKMPDYGSTNGDFTAVFNQFEFPANGVLWQTFDTLPFQLYVVSFDWGTHAADNPQRMRVEVRDGDSPFAGSQLMTPGSGTISSLSDAAIDLNADFLRISDPTGSQSHPTGPAPNAKFSAFSLTFVAQSAVSTIVFSDIATSSTNADAVLDNVQVVPEPSAVLLACFGLGVISLRRRFQS